MNSNRRVRHRALGHGFAARLPARAGAPRPVAGRLTARSLETWARAGVHALPVTVFILALFYEWFAVADRYSIFLYGHLGATAFSAGTVSRYWMAGLVAAGGVLFIYMGVNALAGGLARRGGSRYQPPDWRQVWALCALPVAAGVLAITLNCNQPTLPLSLAAACAAATLGGLALALPPGGLAARRPTELLWLGLYGAALAPPLLWLRAVELPGQQLARLLTAWLLASGGLLAGGLWLIVVGRLRAWRRAAPLPLPARRVFIAGLAVTYLVLPTLHYVLLTPPQYRYISVAANFFALNPAVQAASLVVAAGLTVAATRLEGWQRQRANSRPNHLEERDA